MGSVIRIDGGETEVITDRNDLIDLISKYMGYEMEYEVRRMLQDIEEEYEDKYGYALQDMDALLDGCRKIKSAAEKKDEKGVAAGIQKVEAAVEAMGYEI